MAGEAFWTIGELARQAGLSAKTIRFWSDSGLLPPADRTPAGYRLYGPEALARLGLIRSLRDLGIGLADIRRVLAREVTIGEVAAVHAAALELQIGALRLHQAVLRAVASRGTATPEEFQLMHQLAQMSAAERRRLITEFIDETFAGLDPGADFVAMMRGAMPDLPDEPSRDQVAAWVELAELAGDPEFRASLRQAVVAYAAQAAGPQPGPEASRAMAALLREKVGAATAAGIEPESALARPVTGELAAAYARHFGRDDGPQFRSWLLEQLQSSGTRYERYWQLLAIINGWPVQPPVMPAAEWLAAALRSG